MVIPAKGDEVVGMVIPALGSGNDVVDLEAITGTTTLDRTAPELPGHDQRPQGGGNRLHQVGVPNSVEIGGDHPHSPFTEDLGEEVGSELGARGEGGTGLALGLGGEECVDKDLGHGHRPSLPSFSLVSGQRVDTDRGQGI
jgi:hypothetical protein